MIRPSRCAPWGFACVRYSQNLLTFVYHFGWRWMNSKPISISDLEAAHDAWWRAVEAAKEYRAGDANG